MCVQAGATIGLGVATIFLYLATRQLASHTGSMVEANETLSEHTGTLAKVTEKQVRLQAPKFVFESPTAHAMKTWEDSEDGTHLQLHVDLLVRNTGQMDGVIDKIGFCQGVTRGPHGDLLTVSLESPPESGVNFLEADEHYDDVLWASFPTQEPAHLGMTYDSISQGIVEEWPFVVRTEAGQVVGWRFEENGTTDDGKQKWKGTRVSPRDLYLTDLTVYPDDAP